MIRVDNSLPRWLITAAVLLFGVVAGSRGDALIVTKAMTATTIAEVFIEPELVRVELEIGAADLPAFHNLMPDSVNEQLGFEAEPLSVRLPRFFEQDLAVRPDDGAPVPGRVTLIEPRLRVGRDEITGEPLSSEEEGQQVLFAVLEYALPPGTNSLTLEALGSGGPMASVGFVAYHSGIPVNDFRYLSRRQVVDLDWEDPWYTRFRSRNLRRQYDAPLNVFLYVEPFEVRVEIVARPVDVQGWSDLGLDGAATIPVGQQAEVMQGAAEFFAQHLDLTIDGEAVVPEFDRANFLRRTLRTSTVIDPPEELDANSATLGIIYVAPTDGLPQEARLTWTLFTDKIDKVPGAATDEAGPLRFFLLPDDNILWWRNFLKNPTLPTLLDIAAPPGVLARGAIWIGVILLLGGVGVGFRAYRRGSGDADTRTQGGRKALPYVVAGVLVVLGVLALVWNPGRLDDAATEEVLGGLLHNVYRAFDFRDESTIYDVLDRSVTGDLLTQTYLETRRGLELQSQGGARAKVKEIDLLSVDSEAIGGRPGFVARATWSVSGSVGHWGHIHSRTNQYEADLTIEPVDGVWKITALTLLQEERV